jgi:carbamoyl-phosphate synthase large subunit
MVLVRFPKDSDMENQIVAMGCAPSNVSSDDLRIWKSHGFSDAHIADALSGFPASGMKGASNLVVVKKQ